MSSIPESAVDPASRRPRTLYVDLDGTVIQSDLLHESFLALLSRRFSLVWRVPFWMLRGRAYMKAKLAEMGGVDVTTLPYCQPLLEYLRREAAAGTRLVLATASNEVHARRVADHLQIFHTVLASSSVRNLKGEEKCRAILQHCGGMPFSYAGNGHADLAIWRKASEGILVGASSGVAAAARKLTSVSVEIPRRPRLVRAYFKAIRPHQWLKNLLVFVPLVTAQLWSNGQSVGAALLAFAAFSLCASAIYVANDLLDLSHDRRHPRKRLRPIASGAVPIPHALLMSVVLLAAGIAIGSAINGGFLAVMGLYVAVTLCYSLVLKTHVMLDTITLALLYSIRVIAGAVAIHVFPSFWLLAFCMFLFLSLALTKRCSELVALIALQQDRAAGRDYRVSDLAILEAMGAGSSFAAVLVFALFIDSDNAMASYSYPQALWLLCIILLYWLTRMWMKTARGEMHDDPLVYAARDRNSLVMLALSLLILVAAA